MKREDEERALSLHKKSIFIDALQVCIPFAGDTGYFDELIAAGDWRQSLHFVVRRALHRID